mmetsp:Transcript_25473/g.44839  ORF Transcript_25473/g.44839 Transcript_25473/m.44839 type:complete len:250 (-) Transcript_25473:196-945(-)
MVCLVGCLFYVFHSWKQQHQEQQQQEHHHHHQQQQQEPTRKDNHHRTFHSQSTLSLQSSCPTASHFQTGHSQSELSIDQTGRRLRVLSRLCHPCRTIHRFAQGHFQSLCRQGGTQNDGTTQRRRAVATGRSRQYLTIRRRLSIWIRRLFQCRTERSRRLVMGNQTTFHQSRIVRKRTQGKILCPHSTESCKHCPWRRNNNNIIIIITIIIHNNIVIIIIYIRQYGIASRNCHGRLLYRSRIEYESGRRH